MKFDRIEIPTSEGNCGALPSGGSGGTIAGLGMCYVGKEKLSSEMGAALLGGISEVAAETTYIEPGCLWQNGFRERFHGRFRDEFLHGTLLKCGA